MNSWIIQCYLWVCQRLYHEWAWSYDFVSWLISLGRWSVWRRAALAYLPTRQPRSDSSYQILEIGFGTGELLIEFAQRQLPCVGLEQSAAMHQIVTRKARRRQLPLPRICGEAQRLPFASEAFDAVVATFPASYILDAATLHEASRVLRCSDPARDHPGGRLIIVGLWVAINQPWLTNLLPIFYGKPRAAALDQLQKQLQAAGLQSEVDIYQDGIFAVGIIVAHKHDLH